MEYPTLHEATRRYRLHDSGIKNAEIARDLKLQVGQGDYMGMPTSCFFKDGCIAAIRTKPDEVAIFHLFQHAQHMIEVEGIGLRIE